MQDHPTSFERYTRQMVLPSVQEVGQHQLARARVAIVGMGGLGCPVASILAGAGVGFMRLIDADIISLDNLHRQPLFKEADVGAYKVDAAAQVLRAYNTQCVVEACPQSLRPSNIKTLLETCDVAIDATDRLIATYLMSDFCFQKGIPLIAASVLEQRGYVGVFCGKAPSFSAVFPDMPSTVGSCAQNGVLGSVTAMIGALQAHMALHILLDHDPSPFGRLVSLDAQTFTFSGFSFIGTPELEHSSPLFVEPYDIKDDDVVIELRGFDEAPEPIIANAVRIHVDHLDTLQSLSRDRRIIMNCATGVRSHRAARFLQQHGYDNVAVLVS
jgi:molybdopterin/thiamine biosynthesis adenylyltransferase/rhodanese-related sulfurtransferase